MIEFVAMMTGRTIQPAAEPVPEPAAPAPAPASVPAPTQAEVDTEADYKAAWKEFDASFNGSITAAQFREVMAGLGENVTDAEVEELVNSVDGDDKISCECFLL